MGLGNPGTKYDDTRHNVGWWALDRMAHDWDVGSFEQAGRALLADGEVAGMPVRLVKPTTYMNRSGVALAGLRILAHFDVSEDLMVVVDDAALDVGRLRMRPGGGSGGHNGLESISRALGTEAYPRLRIGVGLPPDDEDRAEWVLAPLPPEDEETILALLPEVGHGVRIWIEHGIEPAMNRLNR